ncbi:MAG: hypothetical protein ACTHV8_12035 [Nesterenkonia sp.]
MPEKPPPPQTPPLRVVLNLQQRLRENDIPSAVGGSGLLASLGLIDRVNDWDLCVDAEPAEVHALIEELGLSFSRRSRSGIFRTEALFTVYAVDHQIDVLVGFALASPSGTVTIPARVSHRWRGLEMAQPEDWRRAYRLMGREDRAQLLDDYLQAVR